MDYVYDDANRMSTVTDWLTKATGYTYDDAGRLTATAFPTGVTESRTYNEADQLATIVATKGGNTLTSFTYTLDNAGIRTALQDPTGTESYTYDNLYRLTGVTYPDTTTQSYTYDAVGNRLTKNTTSYTYDNGDRMTAVGVVSYSYDNNGNQTARGSDTFAWDYENRMSGATVSGTSATYVYRGDGLRHSKTVGGNTTTYTWDVSSELPVILQDGTYTYVYGHGLISQTDGSGVQNYFLANGLGSTEALTDGSGNVIATYKYDVFGAVRSSSGSGSTEYKFTGQQEDATLAYYYLRARYYDPAIGRFPSKDLVPAPPQRPQALNDYAYVGNDPTNLVDPSGLWCPKNLRDCIPSPYRQAARVIGNTLGKLSTPVQLADLLPWGAIPGANILVSPVSWSLDFAAFGFGTYDVWSSPCLVKEKGALTFFVFLNLGAGVGGHLLSDLTTESIVGPPIIAGWTSITESALYYSVSSAISRCEKCEIK
ncbi:MAG: hypothetical protein HY664_04880 [Chloroflexi bacterium]|nr:hypothetical protein [Chloroflexota bacterium]